MQTIEIQSPDRYGRQMYFAYTIWCAKSGMAMSLWSLLCHSVPGKRGIIHAGPVMPWFVPVTTPDRWLTWMKWYDSLLSRCHACRESRFRPVRIVKLRNTDILKALRWHAECRVALLMDDKVSRCRLPVNPTIMHGCVHGPSHMR